MYKEEGEGAHWLNAPMNHSSRSLELFCRTPQMGYDTITFFLRVLQDSLWSNVIALLLKGFLSHSSCKCKENGGIDLATSEACMGQKGESLSPEESSSQMNKSLSCEAPRLSLHRCWNL